MTVRARTVSSELPAPRAGQGLTTRCGIWRKGLHVKRIFFCGGVQSGWLFLVMPRVVGVTRRCSAWDLFLVVSRVDFGPAGASHGTLGPWRSLGWSQQPAGASHGSSAYAPFHDCRRKCRPSWPEFGLGTGKIFGRSVWECVRRAPYCSLVRVSCQGLFWERHSLSDFF